MPRFVQLPSNYEVRAMPRNFGLRRKPENEGLGFGAGTTALMAEGVAVLVMFLGFVVWINGYAIWTQWTAQ